VPKFAANLTMLFGEQPFLNRFAAAKAAGFSGVEYLFPYDFDKADLREQLHQHGLTQVLHNLPAGNWAAGERGIAILPDRVDEFRDSVARAVDYAKALDCRQLNCLVGIAPDGADVFDLNEVLVGNLRFAADVLAKAGIKLLIEPINTIDIPGFFLNKTAQALQLIAAGIVGKLDMGDAGKVFLQGARNVALHHLHVVDVVLHEQIARAYVRNELKRLRGLVEEEAWNIDRVDRLDQKLDPVPGEHIRSKAKVADQ